MKANYDRAETLAACREGRCHCAADEAAFAEAAEQLAANEGPARTPDGVPADGNWHRNPRTGDWQRAVPA